MGVAFTIQASLHTMMILHLGVCCLVGVILAAPLQDTPEVLEAKEKFLAAFETAREGKHAALAPVNNDIQAPQIANAYIDDTEQVAEEKSKFKIAFATAEAGGLKHMQAEPIANFYIAKVDEVAAAEADFMKEFETAEKGEHIKYAPVNNDIQLPQIENEYIPYTWEAMEPAESNDVEGSDEAEPAVAVVNSVDVKPSPAEPAVVALKSVDVKPSPAVVVPNFYNFPAFTYPITPLRYFLLPVTAPVVPQAVAAEAPAVEEA